MARGVGNLNVSVSANTATAIKNLRDFQTETRAVGRSARQMAADFQGSTIADYSKMLPPSGAVKEATADLNDFRSSVVDLSGDVDRYSNLNREFAKTEGVVKTVNKAMSGLKSTMKAVAVIGLGINLFRESYQWGLKATKSTEDFATSLKELFTGEDSRGDKLAKQQKQWEEIQATQKQAQDEEEQRVKQWRDDRKRILDEANRAEAVAFHGEEKVKNFENERRFGKAFADEVMERERSAKEREDGRLRQREQAEEAARKKKDDERKKEQQAREAERRHQAELKKDAETMQKLRAKLVDFGKTDLQRERDETLRTLQNRGQRAEASAIFARLDRMERLKDTIDENRKTLDSRKGGKGTELLDARSAEGWAALRDSLRAGPEQEMLKKAEEQLDALKTGNSYLERLANQGSETFSLN